ncbi:MAG TPA: hypothetical protein VK914_09855 [bacterium]|jgi:hypothetical protein|nr:hypothetical protein [bacterium]
MNIELVKKQSNFLFACFFILAFILSLNLTADGLANQSVTVILVNDGGGITGILIGIDLTGVTLKSPNGDIKEISMTKIEKVFDSEGKRISLKDYTDDPDDSYDSEIIKKNYHHKKYQKNYEIINNENTLPNSGMVSTGRIMFWTGLAATVGGVIMAGSGINSYQSAADSYSTDLSDGNYIAADTDATNEANGANLEDYGILIASLGAADGITGLILWHIGKNRNRRTMDDSGLIHIEDKQVSWQIPQVNFAQNLEPHITLLSTTF